MMMLIIFMSQGFDKEICLDCEIKSFEPEYFQYMTYYKGLIRRSKHKEIMANKSNDEPIILVLQLDSRKDIRRGYQERLILPR